MQTSSKYRPFLSHKLNHRAIDFLSSQLGYVTVPLPSQTRCNAIEVHISAHFSAWAAKLMASQQHACRHSGAKQTLSQGECLEFCVARSHHCNAVRRCPQKEDQHGSTWLIMKGNHVTMSLMECYGVNVGKIMNNPTNGC